MRWTLIPLAMAALAASGCGYTFRSTLDERFQTVHVAAFENESGEYDFQAPLSNAVIRKFMNDTRLRVTNPGQADLIVKGTITRYRLRGITFDKDDDPLQFLSDLTVAVEVRGARTGEILWKGTVRNEDIFVTRGTPLSSQRPRGNTQEFTSPTRSFRTNEENRAASEIIEQIASEIYIRTVEPW